MESSIAVPAGDEQSAAISTFLDPDRILTRADVLASPSPVPAEGGVYGWWFRTLPASIDTSRCATRDGLTLLYVGISPTAPPANGKAPSRETLRTRIRTHYTGNAEASTLRKTLGCLLADDLGIELRCVGSGTRMTFLAGEQTLSTWMAEHALVSWVTHAQPWELEDELIAALDLPLNLLGNGRHVFHPELSRIRSVAVRRAKALPVIPNPGVGGTYVEERTSPGGRFSARIVAEGVPEGRAPLGRLVLTGAAARVDRLSQADARLMLAAALDALDDAGRSLGILTTPAGFVDHKPGGSWHGQTGWRTPQNEFDRLASVAASVASDLMTPALREMAQGLVEHFVLGIDVWPTEHREPHAEVACIYDVASGSVRPVTGKSYPTNSQQDDLIRNADLPSHVIDVGDERLAVLVCHDLAAWSPRGNAVATETRAEIWRAMQAAVAEANPTLAVQLPHTVDNARTWQTAWATFGRIAGPSLRAATTAIRHLDREYQPLPVPFDSALLGGTGWGNRVVDVIVGGRMELSEIAVRTATLRPRRHRNSANSTSQSGVGSPDRGIGLARIALEVFLARASSYPGVITGGDLAREIQMAGHLIAGDVPLRTLRDALNSSQKYGLWSLRPGRGGQWSVGGGVSKMDAGLFGRPLAEALHQFVRVRYPSGIFQYEVAREAFLASGGVVRGTGGTTRSALDVATDLFEHLPGRTGKWRWK